MQCVLSLCSGISAVECGQIVQVQEQTQRAVLVLSIKYIKKYNLKGMAELMQKDQESRLSVLSLSYQSSRLKNIT